MQAIRAAQKSDPDLFEDEPHDPRQSQVVVRSDPPAEVAPARIEVAIEEIDSLPDVRVNEAMFRSSRGLVTPTPLGSFVVCEEEEPAVAPAPEPVASSAVPVASRRRWVVAAGVVLVLGVAAIAHWKLHLL